MEVVMRVDGRFSDVMQVVELVAEGAEEVYYDGDRHAWVVKLRPVVGLLPEEVVGWAGGTEK